MTHLDAIPGDLVPVFVLLTSAARRCHQQARATYDATIWQGDRSAAWRRSEHRAYRQSAIVLERLAVAVASGKNGRSATTGRFHRS